MTNPLMLPRRTAARIIIPLASLGEILFLGFNFHLLGWTLLLAAAALTAFQPEPFRRHLLVIIASLVLLTLAPISTNLSGLHVFIMGSLFISAAALPAIVLRRAYRDYTIKFPFNHGRRWQRIEVLYLGIWAAFSYIMLPIYFADTGSHHNWQVALDPYTLVALALACIALGIWDELFFVNNVLGIFRQYLPFLWANVAQAAIFTTFLWHLGFRGWAPLVLFPFTLLQGYIYRRTQSLLYVITIHLTVDFILYLALIHAYFPKAMPIFLS